MIRKDYIAALDRIRGIRSQNNPKPPPSISDIELLLRAGGPEEHEILLAEARKMRNEACGPRMLIRGLIEFSNICGNTCFYCGLNRKNRALKRYHMSADHIAAAARRIANAGIRTVVLQSGEGATPASRLSDVVKRIKTETGMAVTLSAGERPRSDYAEWREAGADRYLLRIEAVDESLYASLHENRSVETRLQALRDLRDLGYQTGSGIMVGVPGQTISHIAHDIAYFHEFDFDMIGIGPFIPHPATPLRNEPAGDVPLTLRVIALTRLLTRSAWMPTTTALGSMDADYRVEGLLAGANVLMPCFTPQSFRSQYNLFPGKKSITADSSKDELPELYNDIARQAGLTVDWGRGDSLKRSAQDN